MKIPDTRTFFLGSVISRIDPFVFLLVGVSFVGIFPLLVPGYIITDDAGNHLYRMIAFDQALREGNLYPRWFPEFAMTYGYAELSFYSPLSYYLVEFIHLLGFGLYYSMKLAFAMSLVVSGLGMYFWIAEAFRSRYAGFVAAIAYMYFPYRMADIYFRGALAESVALVFLPFVLWSTYKCVMNGNRFHTVAAGVFLALLVITHNVTALFFVPIWLGYAGLLIVFGQSSGLKDAGAMTPGIVRITLSLFVGLALSVFYWLPALQEQIFASMGSFREEGIVPLKQISAYADLIQTQWIFDYSQKPPKVGLVQLLSLAVGLFVVIVMQARMKRVAFPVRPYVAHGFFFLLVAGTCLVMMSPATIPVWETVPLTENIQFPWRLLGFIGLGTAAITGLLALSRKSFFFLGLPMVAVLVFSSMSQLSLPRLYLNEDDLTIPQAVRHEFDTGFVGGTCFKEYLPVWAKPGYILLTENPEMLNQERERLESTLDFTVQDVRRDYYRLAVSSDRGGPLRLHQFFFPGWQASVDGKDAIAYPSTQMGLVTVDMPAGEHNVEIFFGDTWIRAMTSGVSLLVVVALAGGYLFTIRRRRGILNYAAPILLAAAGAFYFSASLAGAPERTSAEELAPHAFKSELLDLGPLRLAGFEFDSSKVGAEGRLRAVFYWQSIGSKEDTWIRVTVKDAGGETVGSRLTRPIFGTARTNLWSPDQLVRDEYVIPVETARSGRYTLEVSTEVGSQTVMSAKLGNFELPTSTRSRITPAAISVDATFGGKIRLVGDRFLLAGDKELLDKRTALSPGDDIDLALYWEAVDDVDADYSVFLHLIDASGYRWEQKDAKPRALFGLTSQWLKGDLMEDHTLFTLPAWLPMGVYRLDTGVYNVRTMERLPIDGRGVNSLNLRQLKAVPKQPSNEFPVRAFNAVLGGAMRLTGATIGNTAAIFPGEQVKLPVKLFWSVDKVMEKDYTVFIHVLDAAGKVVAQADGQPMNGAYPTSFWSPGERVLDDREVVLRGLPSGEYQLRMGAYLPETMARLTTESGDDSIFLGSLQIVSGS